MHNANDVILVWLISGLVICIQYPYTWPKEKIGIIMRWMKEEGDQIYPGDLLCEVEKEKSVFIYYMYTGFNRKVKLVKILVSEQS